MSDEVGQKKEERETVEREREVLRVCSQIENGRDFILKLLFSATVGLFTVLSALFWSFCSFHFCPWSSVDYGNLLIIFFLENQIKNRKRKKGF